MSSSDPILSVNNFKYTMFPIQHHDIWNLYKKHISCFWRSEEIDLQEDIVMWNNLSTDEQFFISQILAFFAASDGIVLENLAIRFMHDVQLSEARAFYGIQIAMENIHSETYSILIDTYISNNDEKHKLFNAVDNNECIKLKADWAKKWIDDQSSSFATRLIAFACVEGIFFSGAFCSIYWLKHRGLMPGLCFSNELISRDEALHCEFAALLFSKLIDKPSCTVIQQIINEAVNIEIQFICMSLPCKLIGMNADLMSTYIKFVADRLLVQLNCNKIYNVSNPFNWMELISLSSKSNFFERRNDAYALSNTDKSDIVFNKLHMVEF